ncbi:hypothetical protein [Labrenzia sp. VG12]|uniref:hypothetical protein n=1 Tax=Labrenzia sp. VG12 TaxID=2021862 RepID=UPI000B8BEDF0|nr:hypothetical protein [Labrenzia sp. VG12]ASP35749.1 hypothetical protein CHH27_22975 [Labrenzia sp. VG12]
MATFRLVAAGFLGLATAACVVFPVPHRLAPKVSGVLLENGEPVADAKIVLAVVPFSANAPQSADGAQKVTTRTDSLGRFELGPLRSVKIVHAAYGDEIAPLFALSIETNDQRYTGFRGEAGVLGHITGTCDLARPVKQGNEDFACDHGLVKKLASAR